MTIIFWPSHLQNRKVGCDILAWGWLLKKAHVACNGKGWPSWFCSVCLLAFLFIFIPIFYLNLCPHYHLFYISGSLFQAFSFFLHSFSLTFSFHSSLPAVIFFHYFIPFFTSSSLSLPLFPSLLPLCLLVSLPRARRPVRFHRLPRKQGLKFKAAVVDWRL